MTGATRSFTDDRRQALNAACARTLAGRLDLELGRADAGLRGGADAAACHARYRLPEPARRQRPEGEGGNLFDALDDARAEALGARWLPGIASNLALRPGPAAGQRERLRAWAYAALRGQPSADCPVAIADALAGLARVIDSPVDYGHRAGALCLDLAGHFPVPVGEGEDQPGSESGQSPLANSDLSGPDGEAAGEEEGPDGAPRAADQGEDSLPGVAPPPLPDALSQDYRVYDPGYDRVVQAHDLADAVELDRLRARLDGELLAYRRLVARLAHQLQRLLLARQRRHWSLDQEEGLLDASRLARLVADTSRAEIFRVEEEGAFRQTCVTLLLDNSGSMRGHPITVAALTADILARALERCGIKVEVLGYTTADWQGGAPARQWEKAGAPPGPGRLNAVRHIVYKAMDTPWRRARRGLGLMLSDDLLKENIDGEALWWACQRLTGRPEPRRLVIVISDGAPMDKATLAANPRGYLDRHLHQVIAWVERNTDIELRAIGIGHQVGRYYRNSLSLRNVDELGTVLLERLGEWLA